MKRITPFEHNMLHRFSVVLLLLLFFLPPALMAKDKDYYQNVKLTKPAKEGKVYAISNRSELLWWAVNDQNTNIKLTSDIQMQDGKQLLSSTEEGKLLLSTSDIVVWPEVYYYSSAITIDGQGHTIYGLYQNGGYGVDGARGAFKNYDYVGFITFSKPNPTIKNLTIADSYFKGKYAGGFMGQKSKVESTATTYFNNCTFKGYVHGDVYAGGLVGWYRTDGQDVNFYRCFNYGTVSAGIEGNVDDSADPTAAGGLIGYFDICHTPFAKANSSFNRCVNYGNITNFTQNGAVAGHIGKVWDNNNGKREWRFCYNFGYVHKNNYQGETINGSGLLGKYRNVNGKAQPTILCCGNARTSDTGAMLDSITWNFKEGKTDLVAKGIHNYQSEKLYSDLQKDKTWAAWINNNWGAVTLAGIAVGTLAIFAIACIAVGGIAALTETFMFMSTSTLSTVITTGIAKGAGAAYYIMAAAYYGGIGSLFGSILATKAFNDGRNSAYAEKILTETCLPYANNELVTGGFAYDANRAMQCDSINDKPNDDKTILFKQHVNFKDATQNDTLPSIITDPNDTSDHLYGGFYKCFRSFKVSNESLLAEPDEHYFDGDGVCMVCKDVAMPKFVEDGQYYAIHNYGELCYVADLFNGKYGKAKYLEFVNSPKKFCLTADIVAPEGTTWEPIGMGNTYASDDPKNTTPIYYSFTGTFDGQGHTISGLNMCDDNVPFGGLFGRIYGNYNVDKVDFDNGIYEISPAVITNVRLKNCNFTGNKVGAVAGMVEDATDINRIGIERSVSLYGKSCVGGFIGEISTHFDGRVALCYNGATINSAKDAISGVFVGHVLSAHNYLIPLYRNYSTGGNYAAVNFHSVTLRNDLDSYFDYCIFNGESANTDFCGKCDEWYSALLYDVIQHEPNVENYLLFGHVISSAANKEERVNGNLTGSKNGDSYNMTKDQMEHGEATLLLQNGNFDNYRLVQEGKDIKLAISLSAPMQRIKICNSDGYQLGDTIVANLEYEEGKFSGLNLPINILGQSFRHAILHYTENGNKMVADENKFEALNYRNNKDKKYDDYALYIQPQDIAEVANVSTDEQWNAVPYIGGTKKVNLLSNINFNWLKEKFPSCIEGNGFTLKTDTTSRLIFELFYNINRAYEPTVTINKLHFVGRQIAGIGREGATGTIKDDLNNPQVLLRIQNSLLDIAQGEWPGYYIIYQNGYNSNYYELKNVAYRHWRNTKSGSCELSFFVDKPASTTYVSDAYYDFTNCPVPTATLSKNNTMADLLSVFAQHPSLTEAFGVRLDAQTDNIALAVDMVKDTTRVLSATLYNCDNGTEVCKALLNADAKVVYKNDNGKVTKLSDGLPNNTLAVLDKSQAALGNAYYQLANNVITSDGHARCISLNDGVGFTYPNNFKGTIHADRAEYLRNVHVDEMYETVAMPFDFDCIEYDQNTFDQNGKIDICFIDPKEHALAENGSIINLKSLASFRREAGEVFDPSYDEAHTKFTAGVVYLIAIYSDLADKLDTTPILFVGNDVDLSREVSTATAPLYASYTNTTAANVANGNNVYILSVFEDKESGMNYNKFALVKPDYKLKAYRGYLALPANAQQSVRLSIDNVIKGGEVTSIKQTTTNGQNKLNNTTYDLQGRKVTKPLQFKAVVIKNGKKVIE